jgi:large subunit ribosomal protein L27
MSHKKAGGSAKNLRDSGPQYLGTKLYDGQDAKVGSIVVRQRGTKIMAGKNIAIGKDHTLFATKVGKVKFTEKRKKSFTGATKRRKVANIV